MSPPPGANGKRGVENIFTGFNFITGKLLNDTLSLSVSSANDRVKIIYVN